MRVDQHISQLPAERDASAFRFTTCAWHNHYVARMESQSKVLSGPYDFKAPKTPFTYGGNHTRLRQKLRDCSDQCGGPQAALVCSPTSQFIAVDVDDAAFWGSRTGQYIETLGFKPMSIRPSMRFEVQDGTARAVTDRTRRHYAIDARDTPEHLWPTQGPIRGGDVKSMGFVPVPGSTHKSGAAYEPQDDFTLIRLADHPALLDAMLADRADARVRGGHHGHGGGMREGGAGIGQEPYSLSVVGRLVQREVDVEEGFSLWLTELSSLPLDREPWTAEHRYVFDRQWEYCSRTQAQRESAGQALLRTGPDDESSTKEVRAQKPLSCDDDMPDVLDDLDKIAAKLKAEQDCNPLSMDWATAPVGQLDENGVVLVHGARDVYERIMLSLLKEQEPTASHLHFLDPAGEARAWLTSREHPLLHVASDGRVYALPDPERPSPTDPWHRWPGWREYGHEADPRAGSSWTVEYRERAEAAYQEFLRSRPEGMHSDRDAARYLNNPRTRRSFQLDDLRAATRDTAARIRRRLLEADAIHVIKKAENYRSRHCWFSKPATYGVGPYRAPKQTPRASTRRRIDADALIKSITPGQWAWARSRDVL